MAAMLGIPAGPGMEGSQKEIIQKAILIRRWTKCNGKSID
jgi:hypothetical protein